MPNIANLDLCNKKVTKSIGGQSGMCCFVQRNVFKLSKLTCPERKPVEPNYGLWGWCHFFTMLTVKQITTVMKSVVWLNWFSLGTRQFWQLENIQLPSIYAIVLDPQWEIGLFYEYHEHEKDIFWKELILLGVANVR